MTRMALIPLLVGLLFNRAGLGSDVVWFKFIPSFSYKDISTFCSNTQLPKPLYLGVEVEGTQLISASLKNDTFELGTDRIQFFAEELSGIVFHPDSFNRLWIKSLALSDRLLKWVMANASYTINECAPTQPIMTIFPTQFIFTFNVNGLGESVLFSESQLGTFKGQRKDGGSYVATIQWKQKQYKPSSNRVIRNEEFGNDIILEKEF